MMQDFIAYTKSQSSTTVKHFQSDNSGEHQDKTLQAFRRKHRIIQDFISPYSHESNRVAERYNKVVFLPNTEKK